MEGCTAVSCKFTVPGAARNWVLKEEYTCQGDNQSARRFTELDKWVARNSNSCEAASNQIARKQTANRESCTRPELRELTTASLSHWTIIRKPHQDEPNERRATRMARASKWWMEGNWTSIRRKFAVKKLRRCQSSTASLTSIRTKNAIRSRPEWQRNNWDTIVSPEET